MADTIISSDFLGSTTAERVSKCRKFAAEAGRLSVEAANPETQRSYRELERQWNVLAAELEATLQASGAHPAP
jgi:hypothetical protein